MSVSRKYFTSAKILAIMYLVPSMAFADAFFCAHERIIGKEGATPEVVITSEGESTQRGAVLSIRCNVDVDGLQVLLVAHGKNYQERRPVLRFTVGDELAHFSALPSRLGNAFLLPNIHEREVVELLRKGNPLTLEIFAGDQERIEYQFKLHRVPALFAKLPCLDSPLSMEEIS